MPSAASCSNACRTETDGVGSFDLWIKGHMVLLYQQDPARFDWHWPKICVQYTALWARRFFSQIRSHLISG